jgi:mRNA interferase MazF
MNKRCNRGEIYFADLEPVVGSEQGGRRPVIIVQNNVGNTHAPTTIVVPVTSKGRAKAQLPTHMPLVDVAGLKADSIALAEQVRVLDKARLEKYLGILPSAYLCVLDAVLVKSLGLFVPKRHNQDLMTLCPKCSSSFFESNSYVLRRSDYNQKYKEPCTICSVGMGFDYYVCKK